MLDHAGRGEGEADTEACRIIVLYVCEGRFQARGWIGQRPPMPLGRSGSQDDLAAAAADMDSHLLSLCGGYCAEPAHIPQPPSVEDGSQESTSMVFQYPLEILGSSCT